jgi:hypothetical protein
MHIRARNVFAHHALPQPLPDALASVPFFAHAEAFGQRLHLVPRHLGLTYFAYEEELFGRKLRDTMFVREVRTRELDGCVEAHVCMRIRDSYASPDEGLVHTVSALGCTCPCIHTHKTSSILNECPEWNVLLRGYRHAPERLQAAGILKKSDRKTYFSSLNVVFVILDDLFARHLSVARLNNLFIRYGVVE